MRVLSQRSGVRLRLTLWYVAAMFVVLAVYAAGVFAYVSHAAFRTMDKRLRDDFRWAAEMAEQRPDGTLSWFEGAIGVDDEESPWLQVWSPAGNLLFKTAVVDRQSIAESALLAAHADNSIVRVSTASVPFRILSGQSRIGDKPVIIQVARSEAPVRRTLRDLMLIFVLGLPLGAAAAGLGGYSLARRALAPVDRMAERARSITAERLSDRLPVDHPDDELGRLASVFNETLGRLESSFEQMRQFTADVSHELRTPLTAIRSVGEVGLREHRDAAAYQSIIGSMLEEADRLGYLVDTLLTLSRAETGQARLSVDPIEVGELAEQVTTHLGVLAEEKRQSLAVEHAGAPSCRGDRLVLRQALINLVDNAIKYAPVGGDIRVRVSESEHDAIVDVIDSGPGISAESGTRIFDRFYRDGTTTERGGAGLGLAIAKWAVEANGGRLTFQPANGAGTMFRITLPIVRRSHALA